MDKKQHQYVCSECNYHREGTLDQPAIGIGSYSTICPECGGSYKSYECNTSKGCTSTSTGDPVASEPQKAAE